MKFINASMYVFSLIVCSIYVLYAHYICIDIVRGRRLCITSDLIPNLLLCIQELSLIYEH